MTSGGVALLGDVGGTNARLAVYDGRRLGPVTRFEVAANPDPLALFSDFLRQTGYHGQVRQAVFGVAGPLADDGRSVQLTNSPWHLACDEIERSLGLQRVTLVNDFAAIAWSLPRLSPEDVLKIGPGEPVAGAPRSVLGPGTGLGVAHLVEIAGRPVGLASEGGHSTMAPANAEEAAILDQVRLRHGHVSAERMLAGQGLVNLHHAIATLGGHEPHADSPEAVTADAARGCNDCLRTLEIFFSMLGTCAGNLALIMNARGGVYIAGGIVPRLADRLLSSPFRERFEAKGRHREWMHRIPTYLIKKPDVAFEGLIALAHQ